MEKDNDSNQVWLVLGIIAAVTIVIVVIINASSAPNAPSVQSNSVTTNISDASSTSSPIISPQYAYTQPVASAVIPTAPADITPSPVNTPQQARSQSQNLTPTSGNLSPTIIAQIEPNVVEINCYSADDSIESSGSGLSYSSKGSILIYTNYHVYAGAIVDGQAPFGCYAVYPEAPDFLYNGSYGDYQLTLSMWHYNPDIDEDAAIFLLGKPFPNTTPLNQIPVINNFYKNLGVSQIQCSSSTTVNVGDGITIFGYPASGNLLGVSETVTEGIISGVVSGPIYKTNAAIDHGNSGGLAILNKNYCSLGIPTLGDSGLTAGIGYIQSYILTEEAVN